ncbi:sensor histidine kinase [Actinosynnema pretiosum]|uniref:sensor histidine kinase n=1 Tax=Actinosynnema pretiosum TaxID=42197 RepID=UPI001E5D838F|nr:histidine kinase [Actinosynnema pretiosum]
MIHTDELSAGAVAGSWGRAVVGVLLGGLLALATPPLLLWPVGRDRLALALAATQVRLITRWHGPVHVPRPAPARCRRYLLLRWPVGLLGLGVLALLLVCLVVGASMLSAFLLDGDWALVEDSRERVGPALLLVSAPTGAMLTFVTAAGVFGVGTLDRWLAAEALGAGDRALLRRRVAELTTTRADVVDAVNDERRRIERDLHDGVQQRVVALGVLVGRAHRAGGGDRARDLLEQALVVSQETIAELRQVALRVYPSALDAGGLPAALEALAERSTTPVALRVDPGRLPAAVEVALYFVASEAVTNAVKHAGATRVEVVVAGRDGRVELSVSDDGAGGADPAGPGLSGLARRVLAADGVFGVDSPVGGPTVVRAVLPCG